MSLRFTKYLSAFVAIMLMLFSVVAGGIFFFVPVIYSFIVIPLLELFMEHSSQNMTKAEEEVAKKDISFDILLWLIVPVQYILVGIFLYKLKTEPLSWWEIIGIISALGMSCGIFGINVAHELGHRNTWYEQLMSKALLLTSLYMHFFIEHNRGHHKNVSTDEDPASARYGETLYAFWLRSIINSWLHAWKLENNRLEKTGKKWYSLQNEMLQYQLIQAGFLSLIGLFFGWLPMLCFIAAAIIGFLLLETVNYVEHYGLRRKKVDDAFYEKVMPAHSWNSNHPIGRLMLFELSRHSDHHYMASRKYQILRHFDQSPQMPTGYPGMMVLSMFPPLWFWFMHREIAKYKATEAGAALA